MSTEARLARLGLLHLIDKPDELRKELERRAEERRPVEEAERKLVEERRKFLDDLKANDPAAYDREMEAIRVRRWGS